MFSKCGSCREACRGSGACKPEYSPKRAYASLLRKVATLSLILFIALSGFGLLGGSEAWGEGGFSWFKGRPSENRDSNQFVFRFENGQTISLDKAAIQAISGIRNSKQIADGFFLYLDGGRGLIEMASFQGKRFVLTRVQLDSSGEITNLNTRSALPGEEAIYLTRMGVATATTAVDEVASGSEKGRRCEEMGDDSTDNLPYQTCDRFELKEGVWIKNGVICCKSTEECPKDENGYKCSPLSCEQQGLEKCGRTCCNLSEKCVENKCTKKITCEDSGKRSCTLHSLVLGPPPSIKEEKYCCEREETCSTDTMKKECVPPTATPEPTSTPQHVQCSSAQIPCPTATDPIYCCDKEQLGENGGSVPVFCGMNEDGKRCTTRNDLTCNARGLRECVQEIPGKNPIITRWCCVPYKQCGVAKDECIDPAPQPPLTSGQPAVAEPSSASCSRSFNCGSNGYTLTCGPNGGTVTQQVTVTNYQRSCSGRRCTQVPVIRTVDVTLTCDGCRLSNIPKGCSENSGSASAGNEPSAENPGSAGGTERGAPGESSNCPSGQCSSQPIQARPNGSSTSGGMKLCSGKVFKNQKWWCPKTAPCGTILKKCR